MTSAASKYAEPPVSAKTILDAPLYGDSVADRQRYFDLTVQFLLTQKEQAVSSEGKCVYRNDSNGRCAVGFHVPDDIAATIKENRPTMMCAGSTTLIETYPVLEGVVTPKGSAGIALAGQLQSVHDNEAFRESRYGWGSLVPGAPVQINAAGRERLRNIAREAGLSDAIVPFG